MRKFNGTLLFSASDLMKFMGCRHATSLDIAYMNGAKIKPREDTDDAQLLQKQGDAHEASHLLELKEAGHTIAEIERTDIVSDAARTRQELADGPDVVFQGALLSGRWGGWSDFLERVETPSDLGVFSYEVTDTKLKRNAHPKHVLQLVLYSDLLAEIQGKLPEYAHLELGDGTRKSLRLEDYAHYARAARSRFEAFVDEPSETKPVPCSDCTLCRWADHCKCVWEASDSLFNVANITRGQVKKLEAAGVNTMAGLAQAKPPLRGIAEGTADKLVTQARLQHARKQGTPSFELRPLEPGKGFDLLPQPDEGDVFYDIEGDPHFEGGLEYLHGVWFDRQFQAFWAHDHAEEAKALQELFEFIGRRIQRFPGARIYHYAPYEITALRRLTTKYEIGEAFLDRMLREHRFVDLFAVVRGGLIASEPNYSIKSMEAFYGLTREGEVKNAGGSVVAYERWRDTADQSILDEIEDYNRIDCVSTQELRDWLLSIRPEMEWPSLQPDASEQQALEDEEVTALKAKLDAAPLAEDRRDLLFNLAFFHQREAKPAQWAVFDSVGKDEDELIDNLDALAGLEACGPVEPVKRSFQREYTFPPQETKLRSGKGACIPSDEGPPKSVSVVDMDRRRRRVTIKAGPNKADWLSDRLTLHPDWPLRTDVIARALKGVIDDQCGDKAFRAVDDLLAAGRPRIHGCTGDVLAGADPVQGAISAVAGMDETILPIQGPPGTGKTYLTARVILSLVKNGYRVGVSSNSHDAIRNLLLGCEAAYADQEDRFRVSIAHKVSDTSFVYPDDSRVAPLMRNEDAESDGYNVVGGTAFFFSRPENIQAFDWLFVDEAGQVGLANMIAMGRAARNIVLVGDPQQLPQVIQGAHPHPVNLSCLEWMLGDHATIPPDRGIFLPVTRRMHPDVCSFISDQVYEGRLSSHPDTDSQEVSSSRLPRSGAFWVPVEHEGNTQISPEEIEAIRSTIEKLVSGTWTNKAGETRALGPEDIIVVAPYNAQVNALQDALPSEIRVGTVDKFQGQEAPVCLVSMTASSIDETPRGMEFLFSLNRINVAVSRAKALALVFGSPRLREAKCETVEQMKLVNTLCALSDWKWI